jgi:hypothetical protein
MRTNENNYTKLRQSQKDQLAKLFDEMNAEMNSLTEVFVKPQDSLKGAK